MPGMFMRLLLVRRRVFSDSVLEVDAPSSMGILLVFEGNKLGRSAAGMYMGRVCRAWWDLGEVGFDEAESGLLNWVLMGEI
jgi:hypothetical protein